MNLATTFQADLSRESLKREAKVFAKRADIHLAEFAHGKHLGKSEVRQRLNDSLWKHSHNANMAKPRKGRADLYASYRTASGWYLAAWRDFRGLTLDDLASEIGSSKGYVSDLETGAARPDRPIRRFNRDIVDSVAKALGTTGGRLIDVNPYELDEEADHFETVIRNLDPDQRRAVIQLAESLGAKTGTQG